jgi:hypothetical protein
VELAAVNFKVDEPAPVAEFGVTGLAVQAAVTPLGSPLIEKVTAS